MILLLLPFVATLMPEKVWDVTGIFQKVWEKVWVCCLMRPKEIVMRKYLLWSLFALPAVLTGCSTAGEKVTSLSVIYAAAAVVSLLLLIGCWLLVQKKRRWFLLLFSSALVVNIGYTVLSMSTSLEMALNANRIAYLGSVFLPLAMLMIILNVSNIKYKKWLPTALFCLSGLIFLIAASPGILDIYYKEVSFRIVNGVATLEKVYGPLHPLYLVYLLSYFAAMVAAIIQASVNKAIDNTSHAVVMAIAVFVNIGVWFIEQLSDIDFEFLSISYIISELFLLGVHMVMNENQRLKELVQQKEMALRETNTALQTQPSASATPEQIRTFVAGLDTLTPTERLIYNAYLNRTPTKEIMCQLNIKENTLKFHNKNLYSKLGVSSRKQLLEVYACVNAERI